MKAKPVPIRFIRSASPYVTNDIAAFDANRAASFVRGGKAMYLDRQFKRSTREHVADEVVEDETTETETETTTEEATDSTDQGDSSKKATKPRKNKKKRVKTEV